MSPACIVGPGGVGAALACSITGCPVVAIGKRSEYVEVYGLCPGYKLKTTDWSGYAGPCLVTFITVKAHQTPSLIGWLHRVSAPITVVVQNGFYGLEIVQSIIRGRVVAGGVADFGVTRVGGRVELRGLGRLLVGCRGRDCSADLSILPSIIGSPLKVEVVGDIEPWRWLKAIVNSVVNTLTAIYSVPNGELLIRDSLYSLAHNLVSELSGIAEGRGVRIPVEPHKYLDEVLKATRDNISSTLQDLRVCREPELGWIVHPFLAHSRTLAELFKTAIRVFADSCGVSVPLPEASHLNDS